MVVSLSSLADTFTVQIKSYAKFHRSGVLSDRADLAIYRDSNKETFKFTLKTRNWWWDNFIYNSLTDKYIGSELVLPSGEYTAYDVKIGKVEGPWEVLESEVETESLQISLDVFSTRKRGGYTIYSTDWATIKELIYITNDTDTDLKIKENEMQIKIEYYYNSISQVLRVFYKYKRKDGTWLESPMGPEVFCHNCSSFN